MHTFSFKRNNRQALYSATFGFFSEVAGLPSDGNGEGWVTTDVKLISTGGNQTRVHLNAS